MRRDKRLFHVVLITALLVIPQFLPCEISASVDSSFTKTAVASKLDLRRYFEEAMFLFESGKYKEAVQLFEKLINVEKANNDVYFTPFAEIYIDKSKARMADLMIMEEKKWERIKKDVISEAEAIAKKESVEIARKEQAKKKMEPIPANKGQDSYGRNTDPVVVSAARERIKEDFARKALYEKDQNVKAIFETAVGYYNSGDYPSSMVEFKKVKEMDPAGPLATQADSYIKSIRQEIKKSEEKIILVKMAEAKRAKMEMDMDSQRARMEMDIEARRQRLEIARKDKEKEALKRIFEYRLKAKESSDRIRKIAVLMDSIIADIKKDKFEEAEVLVNEAMREFPENGKFKEMLHHINMQKLKTEEAALNKARELTEEKMMLEVARKHILPEEKTINMDSEKKITPIVRIPEIRKRLKIPISIDFKDVGLDYVLGFLSDTTGVNIVPSAGIDMAEKKVSIKIKDMPLEETLRYILKSQDLVYRIEEDAVWVATKDEISSESIDTRVYFLTQGIGRFSEFATQTGSIADSGTTAKSSETSSEVKTVKNILENSVDWPKDSKLTLDERTGALIISNTPSNLETIENILFNLDITPVQILIEAKFLEVAVSDLDDIGIEWKLNNMWAGDKNRAGNDVYGLSQNSGVNFSDFTNYPDKGFNLTYQGILSNPQFQAAMHALQEKQNAKTLSAPRITTLNNQMATIEVVDEYIYPTRYEASLVQYDINGDGDYDDAGETEWINVPQDFVTRNVGILLHVKPSVGSDKKTITLAMTPEVSEDTGTSYTYTGGVTIPKFTTRNLNTSVMVKNGETVVLGGLIKEVNTVIKTKVPILGDIPLFGNLFKKSTDSKERRNLLIFVTASIMEKEQNKVASSEK
jgi:Flp pilus assembly secretin CpaC/tetratricopeptide (TPR) repeat protein